MAADFMLLIDLAIFAMVIARAAALLREVKGGPISVEPGCISCELYQDTANSNRLCLEARWKTDQELVLHIRADAYRTLLILLEEAREAPVIEFHDVVETKGLDFVESVRQDICAP